MNTFKKLLYLLQLEEYRTARYYSWLKRFSIDRLEERKNRLKWTTRIRFTFFFGLILSPASGKEKAIGTANEFLKIVFRIAEEILVIMTGVKLLFFRPGIRIVITGSYGKTSFKEMLNWVLETGYRVLKTPENINTRIGIARLILAKLNQKHQILVIEAAAYQPGEIKNICRLIKPNWGIITVIGWMHLERFKTLANIRRAKMELASFISNKKQLFLPQKDHQSIDFEKTILLIATQLGIDQTIVKTRLAEYQPPERRLSIKKIGSKVTILDDSYNSNPLGFSRALEKLSSFPDHQKIVVTPGMVELGSMQDDLNQQAAREINRIADILVIVGETNKRFLQKGARDIKIIYLGKDEKLEDTLTTILKPPTVILIENELPDHYF
jgi:UDP-N-acetylmuramoyl-tripeptide--D-alanyl-D-alanine ligase